MALMLARLATGAYDVLALRNAYHGLSSATMGTVGQQTWKQPVPQVGARAGGARDATALRAGPAG